MSDDFNFEPVRGLPEVLPAGERMLWQGGPDWRSIAWRAYHVREVTLYFAALVAAQPLLAVFDGTSPSASVKPMFFLSVAGAIGIAGLVLLAWLSARSSVYTITSRRVVMRVGVALPLTINLPFALVEEAGLNLQRGGLGDLPLQIVPGQNVSYLIMWPHIRPWRFRRPEPMLRAVPDAARVAEILGQALAAHNGAANPAPLRAPVNVAANDQRMPQGVAAAS